MRASQGRTGSDTLATATDSKQTIVAQPGPSHHHRHHTVRAITGGLKTTLQTLVTGQIHMWTGTMGCLQPSLAMFKQAGMITQTRVPPMLGLRAVAELRGACGAKPNGVQSV